MPLRSPTSSGWAEGEQDTTPLLPVHPEGRQSNILDDP
jgi:hypothetical protein